MHLFVFQRVAPPNKLLETDASHLGVRELLRCFAQLPCWAALLGGEPRCSTANPLGGTAVQLALRRTATSLASLPRNRCFSISRS